MGFRLISRLPIRPCKIFCSLRNWRTSRRAKFPAELTTYKHKGQSSPSLGWPVGPKLREGREMTLRWPLARSLPSFFLPSSLSFFPYARVTFQVSWDCLSRRQSIHPPDSLPPSLPLPYPPGPFQSISNLKFYETKLKLTSHLGDRGP